MVTYEIAEANLPDLNRAIARINRRAERLGCPPVQAREVSTRVIEDADGLFVERFTTVEIDGEAPRLSGWECVATLTHTSEVDLVHVVPTAVDALTPEQIETYRERGPVCEHCHQTRRRNRTFLMRHEADHSATVQVGSTCLKDFFAGVEAGALAHGAGLLVEAANAAAAASRVIGRSGPQLYPLRRFCAYSAAAIRRFGWVSKRMAEADIYQRPTARRALDALDAVDHGMFDCARDTEVPNADDFVLADAAIEWAQALVEDEVTTTDDYLRNVGAVALAGCVERRTAGIAASAVSAYQRARKREWEEAAKSVRQPSRFLNTVGQRCFWRARVERVREFDGDYGTTTFYLMRDADDNVIVWRSANAAAHVPDLAEGAVVEFKATVKKHEYNEKFKERQTIVTRVADVVPAEGV